MRLVYFKLQPAEKYIGYYLIQTIYTQRYKDHIQIDLPYLLAKHKVYKDKIFSLAVACEEIPGAAKNISLSINSTWEIAEKYIINNRPIKCKKSLSEIIDNIPGFIKMLKSRSYSDSQALYNAFGISDVQNRSGK